MRKLLLALFLTLTIGCNTVYAISSPFQPKDEKLITEGIMTMASGQMLIGSSLGKGLPVALSGDATISNSGALTVAAGSIGEAKLVVPTADGNNAGRMIRAVYDVAVDLGTIAAHTLGVFLPANAIITRSWFHTVTQFVDGGSGTVAISCEDANNIFSAADITGIAVGAQTTGVQDDALANFTGSIAASCELTATVATAAQTAGKIVIFVEYVVVE